MGCFLRTHFIVLHLAKLFQSHIDVLVVLFNTFYR